MLSRQMRVVGRLCRINEDRVKGEMQATHNQTCRLYQPRMLGFCFRPDTSINSSPISTTAFNVAFSHHYCIYQSIMSSREDRADPGDRSSRYDRYDREDASPRGSANGGGRSGAGRDRERERERERERGEITRTRNNDDDAYYSRRRDDDKYRSSSRRDEGDRDRDRDRDRKDRSDRYDRYDRETRRGRDYDDAGSERPERSDRRDRDREREREKRDREERYDRYERDERSRSGSPKRSRYDGASPPSHCSTVHLDQILRIVVFCTNPAVRDLKKLRAIRETQKLELHNIHPVGHF